ncbi:MAG: HyaD/HybD family hydrogenase maturation endopeptidase [Gemmatimonadales bacterium]
MRPAEPGLRTIVIGLGSPLMGDDGLGIVALERLRSLAPESVELIDGGTWGMNLLHLVEGADRLLLLDAIDAGKAAGEPIELVNAEVPRYFAAKLSPHEIDLRDVLALAELRGSLPAEIVALGVQPGEIAMGTELTPPVSAAIDALVERAADRLARWETPLTASRP